MNNSGKEIDQIRKKIRKILSELYDQLDERVLAFGNMTLMPREMDKLPYHAPVTTHKTHKKRKKKKK